MTEWTDEQIDREFQSMMSNDDMQAVRLSALDRTLISGSYTVKVQPSGVPRWQITLDVGPDDFAELVALRRRWDNTGELPGDMGEEWLLRLLRVARYAFECEVG